MIGGNGPLHRLPHSEIERASAKIRAKAMGHDDDDYALPIHAERLLVHMVIGVPDPCPRLMPEIEQSASLASFWEGADSMRLSPRLIRKPISLMNER